MFNQILFFKATPHEGHPAFVGALKSCNGARLESQAFFPSIADVKVTKSDGTPITQDPDWTSPADFIWNASSSM